MSDLSQVSSAVSTSPDGAAVWAAVAQQAAEALVVVDTSLRVVSCNPAAVELYGNVLGVQLQVGMHVADVHRANPAQQQRSSSHWERALTGQSFMVLKEFTGSSPALVEGHFQPLRGADGVVTGAFCVLRNVTAQESARRDLEVLGAELEQKVAERTSQLAAVVSELERRKAEAELQRERLRAVLNALPVGVWIADADGQFVARNQAGREIWGEDAPMSERTEDYGQDYRGWWPDGRELTSDDWGLARAIRYGEVAEAQEIEIASWDGRRKVVLNYALPIRDAAGAIMGGVAVNVDITDRRRAEQALLANEQQYRKLATDLLESERTIRQQLAEIEAIYDAAPVGLGVFDRDLRFVRLNDRLAEINGQPRAAHIGRTARELVPGVADIAEPLLRQVLETGEPVVGVELAGETAARPGVRRYWLEHYHPLRLASGDVVGVNATIEEITDRKHAELAKQFLSDASAALASSIEYEETLARVARLAIPFLADYCIVDLLRDDDVLVRVAGAHADPEVQPVLDRMLRYTARLDDAGIMTRVLRSGTAEVITEVDESSLWRDFGERQDLMEAVQALGPQSYLCVPMAAGGQGLGTILLASSSSGRRYSEADRDVAVELGRRAGMAVSNAKLYATAQTALVEAQAASLSKSQFLATMSHELRTPLTGIIGYTELLDEEVTGPLTSVQRQQLARIKASAWHLVSIIDEILLYARMEAGREQLRNSVFDLAVLVQESVFMLEQQASVRGLSLGAVLPPEPVLVEADQGKLRQVLINLIGNAVKFTDRGEVRVVLTVGEGSALVRVRDTGPGIPPDQQQRIFEAFTQADGSSTRRKGGTGLGLTVSRRLAELLGGSLVLEATSAEGSTFLLTLPLRPLRP